MAVQASRPVTPISPHVIGNAFVQQYYHILHRTPDHVHKFYQDSSILGRPDSNGTMTSVTTMHDINEKLLSMDFSNYFTEIETADTQLSHKDGVFIVVTGSLTASDNVRRKFTQSFFLAPQESGGYFVLNDVFRFIAEREPGEMNEVALSHANSTQDASFTPDPVPAELHPVLDLPSTESDANNGGEVINPTVNDNSRVENNVSVDPPVHVAKEEDKRPAEVAPAPAPAPAPASAPAPAPARAPALKEMTKKSYASIVKVMKETSLPVQVVKPKPAPKPPTKAVENVEKSVPVAAKPAQTADTVPPSDNNVSENFFDEQGYSVYVRNLPWNATVEVVEEEFKKFGMIKPGGVQVRNHKTDRFCFGFVEFESLESMQAAIEASPINFGGKNAYVEEKRTTTRVVNGVVTRGDNGNVAGGRFQSGRGGPRLGDNFRGRGGGFVNNAGYRRNDFRNRNEYSRGEYSGGRGRGPASGNVYYQNGNGYHQQRPFQNGNARFGRFNGPRQESIVA